ncbi:MAG: hypothetical protein SFY66_23145 [Oculatellaceae cyanobacterium bins.114]|nr:hypothetical protein [Oculatellaceae cyanobacterium bins.114]
MDVPQLLVQVVIAIICAGIANVLIPRRVPGGLTGLIVIGLAGVWFGQWSYWLVRNQYKLDHAVLHWNVEGVLIVPAIVGSVIILYLVTWFLSWGKYGE